MSCTNSFKAVPHFLFLQVQCVTFYAEVLGPFEVDFFPSRETNMDLLGFFYLQTSSFSSTIVENAVFLAGCGGARL